jgi:hypothetical protein
MANENLLGRTKVGVLQLRKQLAHELIHNECFEEESNGEQQRESLWHERKTVQHEKLVMPVQQKFCGTKLIPCKTKHTQISALAARKESTHAANVLLGSQDAMNAAPLMLLLKKIILMARAEFSRAKKCFWPSHGELKWVLQACQHKL